MNEIKASLAVGTVLVIAGGALWRWHRAAWRDQQKNAAGDDRELRFLRLQFRRRMQISILLVLLGILIPLGDGLMVQRMDLRWITALWFAVLLIAFWIMALAAFDWLTTRMHVRATRALLAGLARRQRELETEAQRLRKKFSEEQK